MAGESSGRQALQVSGLIVVGALVWSLIFGATIFGVMIAAAAAVPAGYAMWQGMQQESQKTSAYAMLLLLGSLGLAALLLVVRIWRIIRGLS